MTAFEDGTSPHWLPALTELTLALGDASFDERLMAFLNKVVPVDHCAVFTFDPKGRADHLFTHSKMPKEKAENLAADYVSGLFTDDPNFPTLDTLRKSGTKQKRIIPLSGTPEYEPSYRNHFFDQVDLIDKASTVIKLDKGIVYCNFYRLRESGRFSADDWQRLNNLLPLVTGLISAHYRLTYNSTSDPAASHRQTSQSMVHSVISRAMPPFDRLTGREREVAERILLGYTAEATGLDLGIASSSVATYRKRAYEKLGITSQNDLFSLCLAAIDRSGAN